MSPVWKILLHPTRVASGETVLKNACVRTRSQMSFRLGRHFRGKSALMPTLSADETNWDLLVCAIESKSHHRGFRLRGIAKRTRTHIRLYLEKPDECEPSRVLIPGVGYPERPHVFPSPACRKVRTWRFSNKDIPHRKRIKPFDGRGEIYSTHSGFVLCWWGW